jgi:DnaK suppressor protein
VSPARATGPKPRAGKATVKTPAAGASARNGAAKNVTAKNVAAKKVAGKSVAKKVAGGSGSKQTKTAAVTRKSSHQSNSPARTGGTKQLVAKKAPTKAVKTTAAKTAAGKSAAASNKSAAKPAAGAAKSSAKVAASVKSAAATSSAKSKAPAARAPAARVPADSKTQPAKVSAAKTPAEPKALAASKSPATTKSAAAAKTPAAAKASEVEKVAKTAKPGSKTGSAAPAKGALGPYASDPKFLEEQKKLLLEERATYQAQMNDLRAEAESLALEREPGDVQFDEESGEGGTVAVDRERDLTLAAQAQMTISQIDVALAAVENRTYGACDNCHEPIPKARLKALPYVRLCMACKSGGLHRR